MNIAQTNSLRSTDTPAESRADTFVWWASTGLAVCFTSALLWRGEQSSTLHTISVALGIYLTCCFVVLWSTAQGMLSNPGVWVLAFSVKLAAGLLLTYFAWYEPLAPDLLRVEQVVPGLQDSNLYDYYAFKAAGQGLGQSWDLLNFTWLSFGITGYLGLVYSFLGSSIAYVSMVNSLLSIFGMIALSGMLHLLFGERRKWALLAFGGLIPSVAFYEATPAKEPLTNALYYILLFTIVKLVWRNSLRLTTLAYASASLILLAIVRANVVMMVAASNAWPILKRVGFIRAAIMSVAALSIAAGLSIGVTGSTKSLEAMFDLNDRFRQTKGFVEERADAGESGLKQVITERLAPNSFVGLLVLSPVRAVIWFYLPYPFLVPSTQGIGRPPTLGFTERLEKVRAIHEQCFVATGWLLILSTPFLVGTLWAAIKKKVRGLEVLVANWIGTSLLVGNLMFIMGRRYRTLIEPLVYAIVLVAFEYKLGKRLRAPLYCAMGAGIAIFAMVR